MTSEINDIQPAAVNNRPKHTSWDIRSDESSSARMVLKSMLLPGEHLLQVGNVSINLYWKSVAMLLFSVFIILLMLLFGMPFPLMILLTTALSLKVIIMFGMAYLRKHYMLLAATNKRVIVRVGIINLEIIQMRYSQIESSEVASTLAGRFLGFSSIYISGNGGHTIGIPFITNALEIRNTISKILIHRDDLEEASMSN